MKNKVVRKLLMIGLSSSVALTSTVGVTAASMDTALEAVAEDETETEKLLMIGLSSSVALTSTVGVTAASMDTALEAVAEDETETETETDSEEETETEELEETETETDSEEETEETTEEVEEAPETQMTPMAVAESEDEKADVAVAKKVTVRFVCDGEVVDTYEYNETPSVTVIKRDELEKHLNSNYKLADSETVWFALQGNAYGAELDVEVIKIEKMQTVKINFYSEEEEKTVAEPEIEVEAGITQVDISKYANLVPEGYELVTTTGKVEICSGYIYAAVRKVAEQKQTVKINFYSEEEEKQILEKEIEVDKETTQIDISEYAGFVPEGYELVTTGKVEIHGGYIYAAVRKAAEQKETVKISFYSEEEEKQIAEKDLEVVKGSKEVDTAVFEDLVPEGYELVTTGKVAINDGYIYAAVRKAEDLEVVKGSKEVDTAVFEDLVPEGYELVTTGKVAINDGYIYAAVRKAAEQKETVKINFYSEEEGKQIAEKDLEVVKGSKEVDTTVFEDLVPEGYELVTTGKVAINDGYIYAAVRKAEKTIYVSYIDADTKVPLENGIEEIKVAADATYVAINDGYIYAAVRKAEKTIYVSYIDADTKVPLENGIEEIKVAADATYFNASVLKKVPAGYALAATGDVYFGEGDSVNVEVRKAEKTVYVSYIDADTKMPLENAIEELKVAADATYFNASALKEVPAGYTLEKTVYVSYIDADTKMPLENAIEELKVAADATYFNASALKEVPAGYTLAVTGDVYFGEGDSVNVEVRKAEKSVYVSYIDEETKMPFENGIEEIKVAADATSFNTSILTAVPAGYELCCKRRSKKSREICIRKLH